MIHLKYHFLCRNFGLLMHKVEPTTRQLLIILSSLLTLKNSMLIIEHN